MALHQAAHHVGLTCRPEGRADLLGLLHPDQAVDDVAALHQQAVHLRIDRIDLLAQLGQRRGRRGRLGHVRNLTKSGAVLPHGLRQRKGRFGAGFEVSLTTTSP
jgi:hypothetical protein